MTNLKENLEDKIKLIKDSRLKLLQLHKMLIDLERNRFERKNGVISSGKFLNLLIENKDFAWLRKFSTLIVKIDETFDLDDGFHEGLLDAHLEKMRNLIHLKTDDENFNTRFGKAIETNQKVKEKKEEIENQIG